MRLTRFSSDIGSSSPSTSGSLGVPDDDSSERVMRCDRSPSGPKNRPATHCPKTKSTKIVAASSGSRRHGQGEEGKRTQHETVDRDNPIPESVSPHPAAHKQVEADIMSPAGGHGPRVSKRLA